MQEEAPCVICLGPVTANRSRPKRQSRVARAGCPSQFGGSMAKMPELDDEEEIHDFNFCHLADAVLDAARLVGSWKPSPMLS